jgi:5-methylcytosine-specific restriction endonuclease McrA
VIMRVCSGPVGGPYCGRLIPAGGPRRCPIHEQGENARRAEKAQRNGLRTPHWLAVRKARLLMDSGLCTFKLDGCTVLASTVHLAPELGGDHSRATTENTQSACRHCHGVVDAPRSHY